MTSYVGCNPQVLGEKKDKEISRLLRAISTAMEACEFHDFDAVHETLRRALMTPEEYEAEFGN